MTKRLTKVDGTSSPTVSNKQKRPSNYSPALEFVHLLREKKCYSLYGATSGLDHFEFNVVCSPINAKPSPDCLNERNPSADHLRMAIQLCWVQQ